ncbi:FHA domain-containing protein, partial [Patescibacteria group bacterium]|nr:FHA domain-containing protein [Patescibacteria group bacterium]
MGGWNIGKHENTKTLGFASKHENTKTRKHAIPRGRRVQGKMLKDSPSLIPLDPRQKAFYITKNITLIGRSEMNDLIPKSKSVSPMHSKIERVSGKYKLVDLSSTQGTFINGRRIDSRFLNDGDEISFESIKYTFSFNPAIMPEQRKPFGRFSCFCEFFIDGKV